MIEIKSLKGLTIEQLYIAFQNAFADYEMQLNINELEGMLIRRGFNAELSFGAFENENLVAFTFNGIGEFNGVPTAYDTGTGTTKEYRGRGLASDIFNYSIPFLKEAGIKQYLLEVLQHNTGAYKIYRNLGFEVTREFNYYNADIESVIVSERELDKSYIITQNENLDFKLLESFLDFQPSWQNSFDSIQRSYNNFNNICVYKDEILVGFCFFEPKTGDITQIAIHPDHRRKRLASQLIMKALPLISSTRIKFINTDPDCISLNGFIESLNIEPTGKQFEMIKIL